MSIPLNIFIPHKTNDERMWIECAEADSTQMSLRYYDISPGIVNAWLTGGAADGRKPCIMLTLGSRKAVLVKPDMDSPVSGDVIKLGWAGGFEQWSEIIVTGRVSNDEGEDYFTGRVLKTEGEDMVQGFPQGKIVKFTACLDECRIVRRGTARTTGRAQYAVMLPMEIDGRMAIWKQEYETPIEIFQISRELITPKSAEARKIAEGAHQWSQSASVGDFTKIQFGRLEVMAIVRVR